MVDKMEREAIVYQILDKDNWEVIDQIDIFLHLYDKMPKQMQLCVDLRMTGNTIREISEMIPTHIEGVRKQLNLAKKRLLDALYKQKM